MKVRRGLAVLERRDASEVPVLADERATSEVHALLERAVVGGIIDQRQADAILRSEALRVAGSEQDEVGSRVRSLVAEALGYVGGALALVSAVLVVQRFWEQLDPWFRVSLLGVVAVTLVVAGGSVRGQHEGAIARLGSFLWFAASGAVAAFGAVVASELFALEDAQLVLVAASGTAVFSGVLWYLRRRTLQQVATFGGLLFMATTVLDVFDASFVGLLIWALGVAWVLLAVRRLIEPVTIGYVLGSAAALLGPLVFSGAEGGWMLVVGLATAAGLVAASIPLRRTVLLGFGTAGLFGYVPRMVFEYFGEALGPSVALLITGLLLMATALGLTRLRPQDREPRRQ